MNMQILENIMNHCIKLFHDGGRYHIETSPQINGMVSI